jgi:hypothetical protein
MWKGLNWPGTEVGEYRAGAKPAQSEMPVRAATKRRPTRKKPKWEKGGVAPRLAPFGSFDITSEVNLPVSSSWK